MLKSQLVGVQSSKELMTVIRDEFDPLHKDLKSLFVQFSQDIQKTSNLSHPSFERKDSLRAASPDLSAAEDQCDFSSFEGEDSF